MSVLCKYKPFLNEFDYPNINGIGDEQIQDIFSSANRFFLLTWLLKNLHPDFNIPLEWSKPTQVLFANIFEESGFCRSAQKLSFVNGDLSNQEQIPIFDGIFKYLQKLQITSQKENIEPNLYTNDMSAAVLFLKQDINLFPTLGPVKLRTQQQRKQKLKYFEEEIERLRREIGNLGFDQEDYFSFDNSEYDAEEVEKNIDKFKTQARKLQEVSAVIGKTDRNEENLGFKPDFDNDLISCNSEVTTILQYFKNVNLTRTLKSKNVQELQCVEQKELSRIMQQHVESSSDVAKTMKNINNSV